MPPLVAAVIVSILIAYLLRAEARDYGRLSKGAWVTFAWMFIVGSRYVSRWIGSPVQASQVSPDGSPIDRLVFLILNVLGILILARRRVKWNAFFKANLWILLYFVFGAASIVWSDFPAVTLKRLFKALGTPVFALVILTERDPLESLGAVLRRLAYVLLPLSVLFINYFPDLGRTYHMGRPLYVGVTTQKNELGQLCLILGIYFGWKLLVYNPYGGGGQDRTRAGIYLIILPMIAWLLYLSESATSLLSLIAALAVLAGSRVKAVARVPRRIAVLTFGALLTFAVLEVSIGFSEGVLRLVGRDPTLTTRVPMWHALIAMADRPLVGAGYESFWLGRRVERVWDSFARLGNAHNGYLETYLSLGAVGLAIVIVGMLSGAAKATRMLEADYSFAVLKLAVIVTAVVYNWTEAALHGLNLVWLLLFLGILEPPRLWKPARELLASRAGWAMPDPAAVDG